MPVLCRATLLKELDSEGVSDMQKGREKGGCGGGGECFGGCSEPFSVLIQGRKNSRLFLKKRKHENGKFEQTTKPLSSQRPLALRVMPFRGYRKDEGKREP